MFAVVVNCVVFHSFSFSVPRRHGVGVQCGVAQDI